MKGNNEVTGFVTQLVYGTLRNYRLVREIWMKQVAKKPTTKIAILLDMAIYELIFLHSESYAVVNEIGNISKTIKAGSFTKFVNAILRNVDLTKKDNQPIQVLTSTPDWLYGLWKKQYGKEVTDQICQANLLEGKVGLRVNKKVATIEQLLKDPNFTKGQVEGCLYYNGNILQTNYFKNKEIIIQSESSQEAVNSLQVEKEMNILDMCAAPGSKTMQLAEKLEGTGKVVANDIYPFRVELIKQNAQKYGYENVETCCHDGNELINVYPEGNFDIVVLDAPCSGLGTLKHKPEIKQFITMDDLKDITALQTSLLETASKLVKANGTILYSTCTLNKKENEEQLEKFIANHPEFKVVSQKTIFPFDYHSDGFFISQIKHI